MKTFRIQITLLTLSAVSFFTLRAQQKLDWINQVGATTMPDKKKTFNVSRYGAISDGKTINTRAIQDAIDDCENKGGGIITFDPGTYLTGSLFVKKNVHLRIDKEVTLAGSQQLTDYPEIDTRVAGIEMKWPAALINIIDQTNVAVSGEGTVHAQGKPFWDAYRALRKEYEPKGLRWIVDYDAKRPRTLLVSNSSNVTLKGLTLKQAGFWTVHILYSNQITVDSLVIRNNVDGHGPSTDGIDIDSSSRILVENCDIDCNDDDFCLKAGRDWDGLRVNRPTEYIVIRDCIARAGGGLITFGSETSGSIRHILAQNLKAKGTGVGLRWKSAITRGGTVEDIYINHVEMDGVGNAFDISMNWNPSYSYSTLPAGYTLETLPPHWKVMLQKVEPAERGIPYFRNVYVSDIVITGATKAIVADGLKESKLKNFNFKNVTVDAATAGHIANAQGWTFENVIIKAKDNVAIQVSESDNMKL